MEISLIPIWMTSGAAVVGVIYAIVRNGSRTKKQDEQLKHDLKNQIEAIKDKLDDPDSGLSAIKKSVDDQRLHCAEFGASISAQVDTNKAEITILRSKK